METSITAPETAWMVASVPVALTVAALLIVVFLLRDRVAHAVGGQQIRQAQSRRAILPPALVPDEALFFTPRSVPITTFLTVAAGAGVVVIIGTFLIMPSMWVVVFTPPMLAVIIWAVLRWYESRYVANLDRTLVESVGRLSAALRSGNGFRQAVEKVLANTDPGPLTDEWRWMLERQGAPLLNREGVATAHHVVHALSIQTPSRRHATFLDHLSVAVGQTQDVLVLRVQAAYDAMQASERRMDEAKTQLSQMRYSGMAVGGAGIFMALYLTVSQWERFVVAYSSVLGAIVGVFVFASLMTPIVGGFVLARADDVDY